MKCPRCGTENGDRTICQKCSYFMYNVDTNNRGRMTAQMRRKEDVKEVTQRVKKVAGVVWKILVIIVLTFWFFMLVCYFTK